MTILTLKVVVAVVVLIAFAPNVGANSSGAGSCGPGNTSIQNTEGTNIHKFGTNGPLADAGVTFSVDGTVLTAGAAASFPTGTDLQWSVDATQNPYKGIFVRVEAAGDFTHVGDPAFVDTALTCASFPGVLGVDHFNSNTKTSVTGTTNFNSAGTATVDVVVVFSTAQWAYAQYLLTIDQVAAPTGAPVVVPTGIPVAAPTGTPVATQTGTPVAAPTGTPVEAPIEAPVEVPVETPVDAPVEAPTASLEPTPVPVAVPVDVPVDAPVDAIPTTKSPVNKPPKAGKTMDMKMEGKTKKGMDVAVKSVNAKGNKKEKKGMKKRRNLRY
jgi:hypothetical protein